MLDVERRAKIENSPIFGVSDSSVPNQEIGREEPNVSEMTHCVTVEWDVKR